MKRTFLMGLLAVSVLWATDSKPIQVQTLTTSLYNSVNVSENTVDNGTVSLMSLRELRDTIGIYFEDFEGDLSEWSSSGQWALTDLNSYSPTHSFVADDNPAGETTSDLISPIVSLPTITNLEERLFNFAVYADMPDATGDGGPNLEDYYFVKIADLSQIPWHRSDFNAYDNGTSWWCGSEDIGGYDDAWLQFLDTDPIVLPTESAELTFKLKYALEEYTGAPQTVDGCQVDGWDVANIRISRDGGTTWSTLAGSPAYNTTSGFGWSGNDDGCRKPGWGGFSNGWVDASFDLSAFANQEVIIRFALGADLGWSTADDASLTGLFVDDIVVSTSTETLYLNDASSDAGMTASGIQWTDMFYDYGSSDDGRPGSSFWQVYENGMQFNGSLDISAFAGTDVRFMWRSRVDDDSNGGDGTGLHIDDVSVYMNSLLVMPTPTGLTGEIFPGEVSLAWDDVNDSESVTFTTGDESLESFYYGSIPWLAGRLAGSAYATRYVAGLPTVLQTFSYVVSSGNLDFPGQVAPILITVWDDNAEIIFQSDPVTPSAMDEILDYDLSAENISVLGNFYVGWACTDTIFPFLALDSSTPSAGQAYRWHPTGSMTRNEAGSGLDGNYALYAAGTTTTEGGFTYNVYRRTANTNFNEPLNATPLAIPSFTDNTLVNGVGYFYAVTTVLGAQEGDYSAELYVFPESESVYTLSLDDGTAENGFNLGSGYYHAVKYTPNGYPTLLKRIQVWINNVVEPGISANAIGLIWADDGENGLPGTEYERAGWSGLQYGWNTKDFTSDSIWINGGSFYIGLKELSTTPTIGVDTDDYSGESYYFSEVDGWVNYSELGLSYNLMFRAVLDSAFILVGIEDDLPTTLPTEYSLEQNYPNPFNPSTEITYALPESGNVEIKVFDLSGREVDVLVQEYQNAGSYRLSIDGSHMSSGIYIYTLNTGKVHLTRKMILLK